MLKQGQVIRVGNSLYHVDYVNECRARCTPLSRREQPAIDDYDGTRGMNISPNSLVEVITDLDLTRMQIELRDAEQELERLRREAAGDVYDLEDAEAELAALRKAAGLPTDQVATPIKSPSKPAAPKPAAPQAPSKSTGVGWWPGPKPAPAYREHSLAQEVMSFIVSNPGLTTAQIVDAIASDKAVAACVSRFNQAGLIHKR